MMRKPFMLRFAILLTTIFVGFLGLNSGALTYGSLAESLPFSGLLANTPPTADAGNSQIVRVGDTVQLDGTHSSDPEGARVTYRWSFVLRPPGSTATFDDSRFKRPSFVADNPSLYLASLTVNDSQLDSVPSVVLIVALSGSNRAPEAVDDEANTSENVPVNIDVLANDRDIDGDKLTISGVTQPANGTVVNNGSTVTYSPNTGFTGQDTFDYTITDGQLSDSASVSVRVGNVNHAPTANAGPDQTALVGAMVQLDGSGSSDPDGDALTFQWTFQSQPAGSSATLTNASAVNPTFIIDQPGAYVVQLIVSDGQSNSVADTIQISTENSAPVANAGSDQTVAVTNTVRLDGSGSTDVDGSPLTFHWAFHSLPAGSTAVLSDSNIVNPSFVVDIPGEYVVELVVNDGFVNSAPDTVIVSTQNSAPVANAGSDQSTITGNTVHLDGSGSSDVDGNALTFIWTFVSKPSGSTASLDNPTSVNPTFLVDLPGSYVVQLIVNDGAADSSPDTVMISTENRPPVANSGPDQSVGVGTTVQLDGSASSDPDSDSLTFTWSLLSVPSGSLANLSNSHLTNPTFVADIPGSYIAQLVVNDGHVDSAPDTVVISTENTVPVANAGQDQNVTAGVTIQLDGSGSTDADGIQLQFTWAILSRPTGSVATISDAALVNPTFVADLPGVYLAELLVNDGVLSSPADTMMVTATAPVITLVATDPNASEAGSNSGSFRISRTGDTSFPLTVSYSIGGTASNGSDYDSIPTSVTIPTGATNVDFTITPVDDHDIEGDETVVLTLLDQPHYDVGVDSAATVTITDNDLPTVMLQATDFNAAEVGNDTASFAFSRTGPTTNPLTVSFAITGSATNAVDYAFLPSGVTIPAGAVSKTLTVTPIDDPDFELTESVTLTLTPDSTFLAGTPSVASIGIADNDSLVSVVARDSEATEDSATPGAFEVSRLGPTTEPLTVFYAIDGSADSGSDFEALPGNVVIPAGSATASIVVTPIDDDRFEGPETVRLTVTPSSTYTIGALNEATVTIIDDERPNVTIVTSHDASEIGPGPGTFTVRRTGPTINPLTVSYQIDGNATIVSIIKQSSRQ